MIEGNTTLIKRTCVWCKKEFETYFDLQFYCSVKCRKAAYYHRANPDAVIKRPQIESKQECDQLDCILYSERKTNHCGGLARVPRGECKFYKSQKQFQREQKQKRLEEERRLKYAEKK